jgi:hypothetical protein
MRDNDDPMSFRVINRGTYDIGPRRTSFGKYETKAEALTVAKDLRKRGLPAVKVVEIK